MRAHGRPSHERGHTSHRWQWATLSDERAGSHSHEDSGHLKRIRPFGLAGQRGADEGAETRGAVEGEGASASEDVRRLIYVREVQRRDEVTSAGGDRGQKRVRRVTERDRKGRRSVSHSLCYI